MTKNTKEQSSDDLLMTPIGITGCVFLVCSWATNAIALNGAPKAIFMGIAFALIASIIGGFGLSQNKECRASAVALGIGLVVFVSAIIIQVVGVEEFMK
jgi:hypothetical protein